MEDYAQTLQNALGDIPVYLGAEWAEKQPSIPHVVIVPSGASYAPAERQGTAVLATGTRELRVLCKAALFDEAESLADLVYAASLPHSPLARLTFRSEVWSDYTVRVADLALSLPTVLRRSNLTRVRIEQFTQHVHVQPLVILEVPSGQPGQLPDGHTVFSDHP